VPRSAPVSAKWGLAGPCALGIPRLAAPGALTMRRPNVPLGEFTSGRVDALLAVVDRWIKSVPAYSAELQAVCNAQAETVSP